MVDAKLLLHPERLRILSELSSHPTTTRSLQARLPDIAQASLYRHIRALLDAQVIRIAKTESKNGAAEKSYVLDFANTRAAPDQLEQMSAASLQSHFTIFTANLNRIFARFARSSRPGQRLAAGLSFNQITLRLSPEQVTELQARMTDLVTSIADHPPTPKTRPYFLTATVIPMEPDDDTATL